jgi:predicted RNA-binding Zn ribbon-like protein
MTKREAPGKLEIVREFVNTLEVETGGDAVATPAGLRSFLAGYELLPGNARVKASDVSRAQELREALRLALLGNNGEPVAPAAHATLDGVARRAGLALRFGSEGARLEPGRSGVEGALGRLLGIVAASMADGTWSRLKACRASDCEWAFYDHTKNRSGRWCSMEVCGNRAKVRAYRARANA